LVILGETLGTIPGKWILAGLAHIVGHLGKIILITFIHIFNHFDIIFDHLGTHPLVGYFGAKVPWNWGIVLNCSSLIFFMNDS
jgi:hypothetical protein